MFISNSYFGTCCRIYEAIGTDNSEPTCDEETLIRLACASALHETPRDNLRSSDRFDLVPVDFSPVRAMGCRMPQRGFRQSTSIFSNC